LVIFAVVVEPSPKMSGLFFGFALPFTVRIRKPQTVEKECAFQGRIQGGGPGGPVPPPFWKNRDLFIYLFF